MSAGEFGEDVFVGDVLAGAGFFGFIDELEVIEEDLAELFGGIEIEASACGGDDGGFELSDQGFEDAAGGAEDGGVDADAGGFHGGEDGEERGFDVVEDLLQFL